MRDTETERDSPPRRPSVPTSLTQVHIDDVTEELDAEILLWFNKRNTETLRGALAFVPWILQQAYFEGGLDDGQVVIHRGSGAVVFSDASGFTALTERLSKRSNGAELLSQCLSAFFTPLIDLINAYRGDVIKFSGDALTIYFPSVNDTLSSKYNGIVPPHGSYGLPDLGPMATSVLRASACCIEIHKRLHMFDTQVDGVRLSLHIGVGCGKVSILQVGGVVPPETHVPRCEYLIAGPPLEQIAIAEPLAKNGQTCLSPQAWEFVSSCVIEGEVIQERPDYHILTRLDESRFTFPTIKFTAQEYDNRIESQFRLSELNVIRRYVPSAVFKQIECGTLTYVNEMRKISAIFVSGSGLDVTTDKGAAKAQELMASVQRCCYAHEGTLNKFLIDDKGMLFLIVFGLPPLVHTDDPTRAVLACFDMAHIFKRMDLVGRFGLTTGRSYCGVCGSARRMEYTVLGDCVNLAARLMANAPPLQVLCDEETKRFANSEILFSTLTPVKVKGKASPIPIFQPYLGQAVAQVGLTAEGNIQFPWYDVPSAGASVGVDQASWKHRVHMLCSVKEWPAIVRVQELLGERFSSTPHAVGPTVELDLPHVRPPCGSPFAEGGALVMEGAVGAGMVELAEHAVTFAASSLHMFPVFGTMGPRPGGGLRFAVELLRSTLAALRKEGTLSLPRDDLLALSQVVPLQYSTNLPLLRQALHDQTSRLNAKEVLDRSLEVVIELLNRLTKQSPVLIVLQFERGTSLFPRASEDLASFWHAVTFLARLMPHSSRTPSKSPRRNSNSSTASTAWPFKPATMLVLCHEADHDNPVVRRAIERNSFLRVEGLPEEGILEYMSAFLGSSPELVPPELMHFVSKVTLGNPLYVRETLDQLVAEEYVQVRTPTQRPRSILCNDIGNINLSSWQHTAMVGGTVCMLEALDPLEAAMLKMSTCFEGPFTLADLAATSCSRWSNATNLDYLRLFKAIRTLVQANIIEILVEPPPALVRCLHYDSSGGCSTQYFQMTNVLMRAIGSAMVLESQRQAVKRQALIDRALSRELPARMQELARGRTAQHIPWYYEQALRRMGM